MKTIYEVSKNVLTDSARLEAHTVLMEGKTTFYVEGNSAEWDSHGESVVYKSSLDKVDIDLVANNGRYNFWFSELALAKSTLNNCQEIESTILEIKNQFRVKDN